MPTRNACLHRTRSTRLAVLIFDFAQDQQANKPVVAGAGGVSWLGSLGQHDRHIYGAFHRLVLVHRCCGLLASILQATGRPPSSKLWSPLVKPVAFLL